MALTGGLEGDAVNSTVGELSGCCEDGDIEALPVLTWLLGVHVSELIGPLLCVALGWTEGVSVQD